MAKTKMTRYLVVVVPAPPQSGAGIGGTTWTTGQQNIVRTVEAASAKEAAEKVGVPAGATAHVAQVDHVSKFKRPASAALEAA